MRLDIPKIIIAKFGPSPDWVEKDDRLPMDSQGLAFYERNQLDWWEQNVRIRTFLSALEKEIILLIKSKKDPSIRLVSWLQMARKLGCDRITLKHHRRFSWIDAKRTYLLTLIADAKKQKKGIDLSIAPAVSEINQLKEKLHSQRNQTALFYDKCIGLEEQIETLKRLLNSREEKIKQLLNNERFSI